VTPLLFTASLFAVSVFAGAAGALLGIGGGMVMVPVLTLGFGVDIRYAIGASVVSIIATSSGAAASYVRDRMANLRVAMFLELGTVTGAIGGAFLAGVIGGKALYALFGSIVGYSAFAMLRRMQKERTEEPVPASALADQLALHGSFYDEATKQTVNYRVARPVLGLIWMTAAGAVSGLLGIGAGALKVPAMDIAMRMPLKASTATSNFMIGVTAAASAAIYFARGDIDPFIAGPVASGVVLGAFGGSKLLSRFNVKVLRLLFVALLLYVAGQMLWKGLR
jgi:uncharacterized membrane protein YfcA